MVTINKKGKKIMKLDNYLLNVLYENFKRDMGQDDITSEEFLDYLHDHHFDDLKRYHLDSADELDEKLEQIQKAIDRRNYNEQRKNEEHKKELLTNVASEMMKMLGTATKLASKKMPQNNNGLPVLFNNDGFENSYLEKTVGRNTIYLTLRNKDNDVIAESSYKMSHNSVANRYYDFDKEQFSSWHTVSVNKQCQPNYGSIEYSIKHFLDDYFTANDMGIINKNANDNISDIMGYFVNGYFNVTEFDQNNQKSTNTKRSNQDWESDYVINDNNDDM